MAPSRTNTPLGEALREERRTQVWLAEVTGVQPRAVWTWVHGIHEPDEDRKATIATALDRELSDLWPDETGTEVAA